MMWNGKYVSLKQIFAAVFRNLNIQEDYVDESEMVEWAAEAIELIGAPFSLKEIVRKIPVNEYKAAIPMDLHFIETVSATVLVDETGINEEACSSDISGYARMRYTTDSFHHWMCGNSHDHECNSELTYSVNDHYITTNFQYGVVLVAYQAIPLDDEGYPKVPDEVKYKQAVIYHIMDKIGFRLVGSQQMQYGFYKQEIQANRDWYIGAAQNKMNLPSVDLAESIKNNWLRLIPKLDQHQTGFRSVGSEEKRYIHNARGSEAITGQNTDGKTQDFYFYTK